MYHQLRQNILARIRQGEFGPGSRLPSENQLCEEYGVSVTTARRAFLELVNEGIVYRKAGVGTIVAEMHRVRLAFISIDYVGDAWRQISSVMGELIAGIGEYAWQHEATLNMIGVQDDEASSYLRSLVKERSVEGVLLRVANDIREEHLEILEQAGLPYVVIKRHIPGRTMNCVISDDVAGAKMATSHLLELGHQRIGFVCAKPEVSVAQERIEGYRATLEEWSVGFDQTLVRLESYFTAEMGYQAVRSFLELPASPTAIFVASDTMALGGYAAARDLGFKIPEDVSFIGYDDILPVSVLQPPLTTIRTSYYEFGRLAIELLLAIVDGRESASRERVIRPSLIVRESTSRRGSLAETPAPREIEPREGPPPASRAKLSGETVLYSGDNGDLGQALTQAFNAEGARVLVNTGNLPEKRMANESAGTLVYFLSMEHGLNAALREAVAQGRSVAEKMSAQGAGCIVYVACPGTSRDLVGEAERTALDAGLDRVTKMLADEWGTEGVRFNSVIAAPETLTSGVLGPVVFLSSQEAAHLSGEMLTLGRELGSAR